MKNFAFLYYNIVNTKATQVDNPNGVIKSWLCEDI